jgi:diadenosine tetraphosphate (Ap4A) HIT family hydrolase
MAHTAIHALVEKCRAGVYAPCVARAASGWIVMGDPQVLQGYCMLIPDPVVSHLNALKPAARAQFLADMAALGDVLLALTGAVRINYAMLGNVEPALHAHLFPRFASEPEAQLRAHPWALNWQAAPAYSEATHGEFKRRVAAAVEQARPIA